MAGKFGSGLIVALMAVGVFMIVESNSVLACYVFDHTDVETDEGSEGGIPEEEEEGGGASTLAEAIMADEDEDPPFEFGTGVAAGMCWARTYAWVETIDNAWGRFYAKAWAWGKGTYVYVWTGAPGTCPGCTFTVQFTGNGNTLAMGTCSASGSATSGGSSGGHSRGTGAPGSISRQADSQGSCVPGVGYNLTDDWDLDAVGTGSGGESFSFTAAAYCLNCNSSVAASSLGGGAAAASVNAYGDAEVTATLQSIVLNW